MQNIYDFIIKKAGNNVTIYDESGVVELASYFDENGTRVITINECNCIKFKDDVIKLLAKKLYFNAAREGLKPICNSSLIQKFINTDSSSLVMDIEPINFDGDIDINDSNALGMCVELPVRNACLELNSLGITTIMSSANKKDVLTRNEKIKSLSNFGNNEHFNIGNGYAWIMIDWESLSLENKQKLILLNNGTISIELSDKEKQNLFNNCSINNFEVSQKELVKFLEVFDYRVFQRDRGQLFNLSVNSDEDAYFQTSRQGYACINSLCNRGINYRVVVLRYPLGLDTSISDVDMYFLALISNLVHQKKQKYDNNNQQLF